MSNEQLEAIALETVSRWRGKLSDPETFEYLYENILAALHIANASHLNNSESNTAQQRTNQI